MKKRFSFFWLQAAVLALPLGFIVAGGCGGGGNGVVIPPPVVLGTPTPAPTATPTPTPDPRVTPTPTPFPAGTTFTPNYVSSLNPTRWSSFPLTVSFVPDANLTPSRQALAVTGFNRWVTATANRVRYSIVADPAQANITVTFVDTLTDNGALLNGLANYTFDSTRVLISARIQIRITGNDTQMTSTCAHEFGHTLGITGGHSPNDVDIMAPSFTPARALTPTQTDVNTLYTIYGGQFPQRTANARRREPIGPLTTASIE